MEVDLNNYRQNIYSHIGLHPCPCYGEDGVFLKIFSDIGVSKSPSCVEFGELRSLGTTTRAFRINYVADAVYFSSSMDIKSACLNIIDILLVCWKKKSLRYLKFCLSLPREWFVTSANIVRALTKKAHDDVDLVVVDIDSYDFYVVLQMLESGIKPRVLVVEYNPNLPIDRALSWPDGKSRTLGLNGKLYGASYLAWEKLTSKFDYNLVHISGFCNLIYIRSDLDPGYKTPDIIEEITDTKEKVLSFCEENCLPGFLPSWVDEPELNSDLIDSVLEVAKINFD